MKAVLNYSILHEYRNGLQYNEFVSRTHIALNNSVNYDVL